MTQISYNKTAPDLTLRLFKLIMND